MFRTSGPLVAVTAIAMFLTGLPSAGAERIDWKTVFPTQNEMPGFGNQFTSDAMALDATFQASRPDGLTVQFFAAAYENQSEALKNTRYAFTKHRAGPAASLVKGSASGRSIAPEQWHDHPAADGHYLGAANFLASRGRFLVCTALWFSKDDSKGIPKEKCEITARDICLAEDLGETVLQRLQASAAPGLVPSKRMITPQERYKNERERFQNMQPPAELLAGFRELPELREAVPNLPPPPTAPLKRRYVREQDGAKLEITAAQSFMGAQARQAAEAEIGSYGSVSKSAFSGLPLGEWALCNASPRHGHALLAAAEDSWLLLAHLTTGEPGGAVHRSDLMLMESALRHAFAKPPRSRMAHIGTADFDEDYVLCGKEQGALPNGEVAPVAPILLAAGLRVVHSKDLPAVRGWRGDHLVITIVAGAQDLLVEGKRMPLGGRLHCFLKDGQLYAPISPVAVHVGLCTYLRGVNREQGVFHVEQVNAPRPGQVFGLALPQ